MYCGNARVESKRLSHYITPDCVIVRVYIHVSYDVQVTQPNIQKTELVVTRENGDNGEFVVMQDATQRLELLQDVDPRKPREMREDCR